MSFAITAIVATVGTALYSQDQQRKNIHRQQDALNAAEAENARSTAEAETSAQVAANSALAETKRRRRASALELGDPQGLSQTLGGSSTALSAGISPAQRAAYYAGGSVGGSAGTALGAGAGVGAGSGRKLISPPARGTGTA